MRNSRSNLRELILRRARVGYRSESIGLDAKTPRSSVSRSQASEAMSAAESSVESKFRLLFGIDALRDDPDDTRLID